jgi:hypothetical protein
MASEVSSPQRILGMWTGIENMLIWIIAAHVAGNDPARFDLFMKFCADSVNSKDRVRMLREVVEQKGLGDEVGEPVFTSLNRIIDVRNEVAHVTAVQVPSTGETVWIKIKKGQPTQIPLAELEAKVAGAEETRQTILDAVSFVAAKVGYDLRSGWENLKENEVVSG